MGGDVAERASGAGAGGIAAPVGLLVAGEFSGEPVLRVFGLHDAEIAEFARLDHGAGLARHGVAGIVVREDEGQASAGDEGCEIVCVLARDGHRLVADDGDGSGEEFAGDGVVRRVGRDDRDGVDAVGAFGFAGGHGPEVGVGAVRLQAHGLAEGDGLVRVGLEVARNEIPVAIEAGSHAMDAADEGALAAADHSELEAFQRSRPKRRRLAFSSVPLAAKSSKARGVTRMMWSRMKAAPSRAPSSGCLMQHSHSSTAQPS